MATFHRASVPDDAPESVIGLVKGNTIRARHLGHDFMAGLKNIVGGELKGYTELLQDSRQEATERMVAQAKPAPNSMPFWPGDAKPAPAGPSGWPAPTGPAARPKCTR